MRKAAILLLGLVATTQAHAVSISPPPTSRLTPEPQQVLIASFILQVAQNHHYPGEKLDAKLAHAVLDQYFDALDPTRFYLTNEAIKRFHGTYDKRLADDLRRGNLKPAFAIYRYYIGQVRRQTLYTLQLLKKEPDFTAPDSFRFERWDAPWAADQSALDQLWSERVKSDALMVMLNDGSWAEAVGLLTQRYRHDLTNADQTTSTDVFGTYMNAYMQALDPHSSYLTGSQVQQIQSEMSTRLQGIGAQLTDSNGYVTVERMPAAEKGELEPGDRIVGVGQDKSGKIDDVTGWPLDDVIKRIRGPAGTVVRLRVLPAGASPGAERTIILVRHDVEPQGERAHARTALVTVTNHTYKIGIIEIPSFYMDFGDAGTAGHKSPSVTGDVRALLAELKAEEVSGILLDLRNNSGGALEQAVDLTGLFIPHGPVLQVQSRSGQTQQLMMPSGEATAWNGPLALLTNRFAASATEIFTGALKDYHRAVILGSRTWGNGTIQQLVSLDKYLSGFKAGVMKLTVAQVFRVNGSSIQSRGVTPDIAIPSPINDKELGEDTYPNALPWKSVAPADYKPVRYFVSRLLPKLQEYFTTTVQMEPGYRLFADEISRQSGTAALATVSLSLETREHDQAEDRARALGLDNAWRKLEGKPAFKDLEAAYDSKFAPPDVPIEVGKVLLAEYISLLPRTSAPFEGVVTELPAPATSSCAAPLQTARQPGRCIDHPGKIILPPNAGTTTGQ